MPEPAGSPPKLTEAQRARLHQLLRQQDSDGNAVYHLHEHRTDQEKWDAYTGKRYESSTERTGNAKGLMAPGTRTTTGGDHRRDGLRIQCLSDLRPLGRETGHLCQDGERQRGMNRAGEQFEAL